MIADMFSSFSVQVVGAREMILPYADAEPEVEAVPEVEVELGWIVDDVGLTLNGPTAAMEEGEQEYGSDWLMEGRWKSRPRQAGAPASGQALSYERAVRAKKGRLAVLGAGDEAIEVETRSRKDKRPVPKTFWVARSVFCPLFRPIDPPSIRR